MVNDNHDALAFTNSMITLPATALEHHETPWLLWPGATGSHLHTQAAISHDSLGSWSVQVSAKLLASCRFGASSRSITFTFGSGVQVQVD